jgi:hypothetical protein
MNYDPNWIVPTAPLGTSDNRSASTAFVQAAISGGGTGGGVIAAATIAQVMALPTLPGAVVYLADPVRQGPFLWTLGNFTDAVHHDPGQGVYIASASDPTGALGCWVRAHANDVDWAWWGMIGDGVVIDRCGEGYALLTSQIWAAGVTTYITNIPHQLTVGGSIQIINSLPAGYNGFYVVVSVVNPTTFTVAQPTTVAASTQLGVICGPVILSGTDNSIPFANWSIWAAWKLDVSCVPSPGTYVYNGGSAGVTLDGVPYFPSFAFTGIRNFTLDGKHVVAVQNSYSEVASGANSARAACMPFLNLRQTLGVLIQTTVPNTRTFTLVNASDASRLKPRMVGILGSMDAQTNGYPQNCGQFEYITIQGVSGLVVTIIEVIQKEHRSDFPDYALQPGFNCGAARLWLLDDPAAPVPAQPSVWQGKVVIKGMMFNKCPGMSNSQPYATMNKMEVETQDWDGVGLSETVGRMFLHTGDKYRTGGEIDKFVQAATYNNVDAPNVGLGAQSTNPNRMIVNNSVVGSIVGFAKQLKVTASKIGVVQPGGQYGLSEIARFEACDIWDNTDNSLGLTTDGQIVNTIDGTNAYWCPAGVFVGSITGNVLTITSITSGSTVDMVGCYITGTGVALYTLVQSMLSGPLGSVGSTYSLSTTLGSPISGVTMTIGNTGVLKVNFRVLSFASNTWPVIPGTHVNLQANVTGIGAIFSNDFGGGIVLAYFMDNTNYQIPLVTSGTYDTVSGQITVNTPLVRIYAGDIVSLFNLTGTGANLQTLVGNWPVISNSGTVLVLQGPTGEGAITITGGQIMTAAVVTIRTTLRYSATPSWSNGKIAYFKNNVVSVVDCTGSDGIRLASDAYAAGQRYFEYKRYPFGGLTGQSMFVGTMPGCLLNSITVNVEQPSAIATARLSVQFTTIQYPAFVSDGSNALILTIDLSIIGTRVINLTSFTGKVGADALTLLGVAQTALPASRVVSSTMSIQLFTTNHSDGESAVGDIIVQTSAGMVRKTLTKKYDGSGTLNQAHTLIPVQGTLP